MGLVCETLKESGSESREAGDEQPICQPAEGSDQIG